MYLSLSEIKSEEVIILRQNNIVTVNSSPKRSKDSAEENDLPAEKKEEDASNECSKNVQVTEPSNNESCNHVASKPSEETLTNLKMPPRMNKRERPKGGETTVIGVPKKKSKQCSLVQFIKLSPKEKDRFLLECLVHKLTANDAMKGSSLIEKTDLKAFNLIPDSIRNTT